jgi:hypothetical protein
MLPKPLPTPYDITDIPYVPWSPGTREWILLLLAACAALVLISAWHLLRRGRKLSRVVDRLLEEIERSSHQTSVASTERISRAARRVIEHTTQHDLGGLSPDEISAYAAKCADPEEVQALRLIADLESHLYAPPSAEEKDRTREIARALLPALTNLVEIRRRR